MSVQTSYGNTILIPFDCFVDIDYGLIMLMKKKYNNPEIIYNSVLESDETFIVYALMNRTGENPLEIIMKEKYSSVQDKFRNEFFEKEYDNILKLSKLNNIFDLLKLICESGAASIDILCKNVEEKNIADEILKDVEKNIIVQSDISKIDMSKYDSFFIRNYKDVLMLNNLVGKNIYILDYKFNVEMGPDEKIRPIVLIDGVIGDKNTTSIISPYNLNEVKIYG